MELNFCSLRIWKAPKLIKHLSRTATVKRVSHKSYKGQLWNCAQILSPILDRTKILSLCILKLENT